jgi:hypothetical protein
MGSETFHGTFSHPLNVSRTFKTIPSDLDYSNFSMSSENVRKKKLQYETDFKKYVHIFKVIIFVHTVRKKLRGFGPLANYADRATAASWRSSANFCG